MVTKALFNMFSMLMAFLVLLSTVSFTVEKHFCGDILIDVAVFSQAEKCKMEAFEMKQNEFSKKNCCKDELEFLKGQDQLKKTNFEDFHVEQQIFLTSFIYSYVNLFEGLPQQIIPHKNYSPPNLVADIHVMDQVFII